MKRLLVLTIVLVLGLSTALFADETKSVSVSASLPHGVSLADPVLIQCEGDIGDSADPWTHSACSVKETGGIDFGELTHEFPDETGAGCFFSPTWFIVYLYPDAWGGAGYDITQTFQWTTGTLRTDSEDCLVFTAVYSEDDRYEGAATGQGPIPGTLGNNGAPQSAVGTDLTVYESEAVGGTPVIVRAQYGIPPYPASGDPDDIFPGWTPLSKKQEAGPYGGTVYFTITEK